MELAIPLVAIGGLFILSKQDKKKKKIIIPKHLPKCIEIIYPIHANQLKIIQW